MELLLIQLSLGQYQKLQGSKIEKKIKAMNGNYILVRSLTDFWEKFNKLGL